MKLIIDAQLPSKLCEILDELGINSIHVNQLPKGVLKWEICTNLLQEIDELKKIISLILLL